MKKKLFAAVLLVALCLTLFGCADKKQNEFFNNFTSRGAFSEAEEILTLSDGVGVYSYDADNGVFITYSMVLSGIDNNVMVLYGLADRERELLAPTYSSVIAIKGDYAIVTKPYLHVSNGNRETTNTVGVIRFRGDNTGELTDFLTEYTENFEQFRFIGDYIATIGTKDNAIVFNGTAYTSFCTIYDYSQGLLLEKFRIRCNAEYDLYAYDGHVVAVNKDHAFFYAESDPIVDGYKIPDTSGYYIAYPEDEDSEYTNSITTDIFYLGNGWFSRTARLESAYSFQGYNMMYEKEVSGTQTLVYANVRCDFYNVRTREKIDKGDIIVQGVANKYNYEYYSELADYLNNLDNYDSEKERYEYSLPYMNMAETVKDGYSIVWFYYFPYEGEDERMVEVTFGIMDDKTVMRYVDDALMPLLYIDGMGVETADPTYDVYYGSISYFDYVKEPKRKTVAEKSGGTNTYAVYLAYGGYIVASEISYENVSVKYGMVDNTGAVKIPFEYVELSPFYGDYCIGTREFGEEYQTYRISKDGEETALTDVESVHQGVYVYQNNEKFGLKNYAGDVLLSDFDTIDVFDVFMREGAYQTSYAIAVKDERTHVYKLN